MTPWPYWVKELDKCLDCSSVHLKNQQLIDGKAIPALEVFITCSDSFYTLSLMSSIWLCGRQKGTNYPIYIEGAGWLVNSQAPRAADGTIIRTRAILIGWWWRNQISVPFSAMLSLLCSFESACLITFRPLNFKWNVKAKGRFWWMKLSLS